MSAAPTRLLVIGIDAASPDLLDEWIADGTLPNLAALRARGLSARTRGIDGFFVGSTWPSMYTGANPAQHGFHYQMQLVPGSYRLEDRALGAFVEREPFWRVLSRAGRRVAVLDVPLSKLEPDLAGVQVVEWGGHDALFGYGTLPHELAAQIRERHGAHPLGVPCDGAGRGAAEYGALVAALEEGVRRKTRWSIELLERGGWDLFMQVFTESHCVGHQCWHLHDPAHPAHDPAIAASGGDPVHAVYRAIDAAVGELSRAAGDAQIIVFSAHGMSHRFGAHFLLCDILCALGVATPSAPARRGRVRAAAALAWRALPGRVRAALAPVKRFASPHRALHPAIAGMGVDPARSSCFPLANGLAVSGIRLNLAGREPHGILAPGAEAERFVAQLESDLMEMKDETTGAPLVARVMRTRELYAGDRLDALPDVLVEWNDAVAIGSTALGAGARARAIATSPKIGAVAGANDYGRSGEHRAGGWLVAAGPGIPHGRLHREPSLLDLAPTFTRMLGVDLEHADGTTIRELAH